MKVCSLKQAARLVGLAEVTIVIWERKGLIPPINRPTGSSWRDFSEADLERLRELKRLHAANGSAFRDSPKYSFEMMQLGEVVRLATKIDARRFRCAVGDYRRRKHHGFRVSIKPAGDGWIATRIA